MRNTLGGLSSLRILLVTLTGTFLPGWLASASAGLVAFDTDADRFVAVDSSTGSTTPLGSPDFSITSLTFSEADNSFLATRNNLLFNIDVRTVQRERSTSIRNLNVINELAYDPLSGSLFAIGDIGSDSGDLFRIDSWGGLSAEATRIAFLGAGERFFNLTFDPQGSLYSISNEGNLYSFDKNTGARARIGAGGLPYFVAVAFDDTTDSLVGIDINENLHSIDRTTGVSNLIGNVGSGRFLTMSGGLASVPEPSSISFLALASVGFALKRHRKPASDSMS